LWNANFFIWKKYAIVAVVSNDKNGKEELWLVITSNIVLLPFFYHKMPPIIYMEQLNAKMFKKWIFAEPSWQ
jgi:hypothetical protein